MKSCLVTGADGFIGSHLTETLVRKGYKVKALCQYNSFSNYGWLENINSEAREEIEIKLGDVRDSEQMNVICKGVDNVYHLAALIAIPYSYETPRSYVDTNIIGTINMLNACRVNEVGIMVQTSTSECYGSASYVPMDENHPINAQSPYAATKIAADQLCLSYNKSFNQRVAIIRPFNTYGPRQSARAVIPTIITQALENEGVIKLGALSPTRDFNYVSDICEAFVAIGTSEKCIGEVVNACTCYEISIEETAKLICDILNIEPVFCSDEERMRPKESEVNRLYGDNKLIKEITSWEPNYFGKKGFREGLRRTINWFTEEKNQHSYKSMMYNI